MGVVYLGENTAIGRRVAVKVMHLDLLEHAILRDRFEREARAAARIRSPHVVEVLDLAECDDGLRYIVMEYLDGESLAARIERSGPIPVREATLVAMQLLDGVRAAHDAEILHRDLKPENVFLSRQNGGEIVKILDFGISKLRIPDIHATGAGELMGTPDYMSPEQARGEEIDARSDLYAVAVSLYEALSGHIPFVADNLNALLFKIATHEPTPLEAWVPEIDQDLAAIVRRAMAHDPASRFATAAEFREALADWRERAFGADAAREDLIRLACALSGERWSARVSYPSLARTPLETPSLAPVPAAVVSIAPPAHPAPSVARRHRVTRGAFAVVAAAAGIALAMLGARQSTGALAQSGAAARAGGEKLMLTVRDQEGRPALPIASAAPTHPPSTHARPRPRGPAQVAAAVPSSAASAAPADEEVHGYRANPYDLAY